MLDWVPPETELVTDVSPADWVLQALRPWALEGGVRLWSFMPAGYEALARVFHPVRERSGMTSTWRALAAKRGISLTPDISFLEVSGLDPEDQNGLDDLAPMDGNLPAPESEALARVLRPHARRSESCWFCLWEGNGAFWSGAHTEVSSYSDGASESEKHPYVATVAARMQDEVLGSTPRVMAQARNYFLFKGPLEAACGFEPATWHLSPNLWWPDDRSWCVITEIEGYSTYVGGSRAAIDDVLSATDLEAIEVPRDVHMDPGPYVPFWR